MQVMIGERGIRQRQIGERERERGTEKDNKSPGFFLEAELFAVIARERLVGMKRDTKRLD